MIVTTTENVPGKQVIESLGIVRGSTVRSKHFGRDIMAGLKGMVGGEIRGYTELMIDAREEAHARMVDEARKLGADAVVNVRFMTSMVAATMSELLAYGTAVRLA